MYSNTELGCGGLDRVLFEFYSLYIVGSVQWALNSLENQQMENKSCSASVQYWGARLFGFIGSESLWCSRNNLGSTDPLEGQFTWSGGGGYWKTTCRLIPPHLYICPFIHFHSLVICSLPVTFSEPLRRCNVILSGIFCCHHYKNNLQPLSGNGILKFNHTNTVS